MYMLWRLTSSINYTCVCLRKSCPFWPDIITSAALAMAWAAAAAPVMVVSAAEAPMVVMVAAVMVTMPAAAVVLVQFKVLSSFEAGRQRDRKNSSNVAGDGWAANSMMSFIQTKSQAGRSMDGNHSLPSLDRFLLLLVLPFAFIVVNVVLPLLTLFKHFFFSTFLFNKIFNKLVPVNGKTGCTDKRNI